MFCAFRKSFGRSGTDATGQIPAKLFDDIERFKDEFEAGEFVRVEGRTTIFHGQLQLTVAHIRRLNPDQDRLQGFREEDCILCAPRSIDEMWSELAAHVDAVRDPHIRVLLKRVIVDHEKQLREWPAAQQVHHAYARPYQRDPPVGTCDHGAA